MFRRMIAASVAAMMLLALIPASMAESSEIGTYNGLVGADSPLYTIKLYVEKLDVFITFDSHDKLKKQMAYADKRLSEARAAANSSNAGALDAALTQYALQLDEASLLIENGSDAIEADEHLTDQEDALTDIMNDPEVPLDNADMLIELYNQNIDIKNGLPFIYVRDGEGDWTAYFAPPGQLKKIDSKNMPPGLAKKGYKKPARVTDENGSPVLVNGNPIWPWENDSNTYVVTHANGNGNGKGNNKNK